MDSETSYFFGSIATQLRLPAGRRSRALVERWAGRAPALCDPGVTAPAEIPAWLIRQSPETVDAVLGALLGLAQEGDSVALMCVLVCLRPGACRLIASLPVTEREVLSELALRLLDYPVARRPRSVAGGILLDVRNRLGRAARRASRETPVDHIAGGAPPAPTEDRDPATDRLAVGGEDGEAAVGKEPSATEVLVELVASAHSVGDLTAPEASLILRWRVLDEPVSVTAQRHGTSASAAKKRRQRAEARLLAAA